MEPRGRGRARGGRARGEPSQQQTNRPGPAPGPQRGPQRGGGGVPGGGAPRGGGGPPRGGGGGPAPQGAWGRPQEQRPPLQQAPQPPQGAWGKPQGGQSQQSQSEQSSQGRGTRGAGGEEPSSSKIYHDAPKVISGSGDAGVSRDPASKERGGGNGVRGRSNRHEIIHTRPANMPSKQGSSGNPITLSANYFKIINRPDWCLQEYRVDFNPEVDDIRMKRKLMYTAYKQENDIGGFLFDGSVMYTPLRLRPDPMERVAKLEETGDVRVILKWVGELAWGDYHYLQVFNILVRKCLRLMDLQLVGRNYFDPKAEVRIPDHRLCLWPGYYTSIRQHEKDIMMNTELTFKVMRTDNVYDLLLQTLDRGGRPDLGAWRKKVIGNVVLTFYNNKTYKIDDVEFNTTPESTFTLKSGEQISYANYFQQKYRISIQVRNQPMLISLSSPREIRAGMAEMVYLVPELCQLTGLSDEQRANFHLMSAVAQHTRVAPPGRRAKLKAFVDKMTSNAEIMKEVKRWDLGIANNLVEFQGRVLNQEKIRVDRNVQFPSGPKADWTNSIRANPMLVSANMSKLAVISPRSLMQPTDEFMKLIIKTANGMNMRWERNTYQIFSIENDRSAYYLDKLDEILQSAPTLVMCVLPNKTADRYNAIKKKCCVDSGIPSQVVVARNFKSKGVMSIATKVAIQLNCKIGGAPWTVAIPMKGLMVVGYDVCRDTANKKASFGGMVASLDATCSRYYSSVAEHQYEEELSNNFGSFLLLACYKYKELNGAFPAKICIYRDGVGDGQIQHVIEHEVKHIRSKLEAEIYKGEANPLRMAFVVVSKRINTRIFNNDQNPPPGTVVDNTITLPERYDFFIVSQCVNQGTVAPTNFNVIHDNMGLPPDHMQMLAYKMCHMYYNWSGTVRVPAPCQYAHKLAFLTAQSLHRPAHRNLDTLLYYL